MKMQESDNEVEIVNVIETNIKKDQEEVKELSPDRSIVKVRNPQAYNSQGHAYEMA